MKYEKIGNIANFINGAAFKPEDWSDKGFKIIRIQNLTNSDKPYNRTLRKVDKKYFVEKGDVLVSWSATIDVFIWDEDEKALLNQHIFKVNFDFSKIEKRYFIFSLKSTIDELSKKAHGSTMKHVVKKDFENHEILLPELADQIRIAEVLTKVETLIQQRKQSIDLLDDFLKSTFLDIFGDPVKNEKNWDMVKLSQLGSLDRGISKNRPRNAPELLGGIYPLIQTGEVSNAGLFIKKYKNTYSELGLKQSKLWYEGTMLITIAANIAQTSILTFKACFPDSIVGFNSNKKESNVIYVHFLFSFLQKILEYNAPSSAQKNINLGILRELKVPKPSIKLQNKFASIVEKAEKVKEQYRESLNELQNLFGSLSQKAFKGELDLSKLDVSAQIREIEKKIEAESGLDISFETKLSKSMYQFIKQTADLQKQLALVNNMIPKALIKQIENINKSIEPFQNLNKIPEQLAIAMQSFNGLKSITNQFNQETKEQFKTKLTWEEVNFEMVANWIKGEYSEYHFNSEILMHFLENERVIFSNYHSSEELKTNPKLNEADDIKSFVFSALKGKNQFIKLEQFFYDAVNENVELKLRSEDYEVIKNKEKELRSGIYFKVVE